jgi:16S rRNA (guanine527-N7)-methyltransferase
VLAEAQRLGFLGPPPIEDHLRQARAFVDASPAVPTRFLDLGSGGGVPGLPLALAWSSSQGVLLEGSARRSAFLRRAVRALGLADRVTVLAARAEVAGRSTEWRAGMELVVARLFGPPATVAECAAPLLTIGGMLLVSEPPERPERWPTDGLAQLGMEVEGVVGGIRRLLQVAPCPARLPRRTPGKPPLF